MAVKFRKVKRRIMSGDEEGTFKYYGMAKSTSVSGLKEICNLVCARSTLSPADVRCMIESLDWVIDHELRGGRTVKLGELGTFRMSLKSEGAITRKELTAHKIRKGKVIFTPGATLLEAAREVSFEPYEEDPEENPGNSGEGEDEGSL